MGKLTDEMTVKAYQHAFFQGYDHQYPNENIVRLEGAFLSESKGKCLDYGYGFAENLIHLAKKGYETYGIDIDETLIGKTQKKISDRKLDLQFTPQLTTMDGSTDRLPYEDNSFDCILSNQVVYLLADEEKVKFLLDEFYRIVRPGGHVLITLMGEKNVCCVKGKYLGGCVYEYDDSSKMNKIKGDFLHRYHIVHSEAHIKWLFDKFNIDEVGSFDNSYFNIGGHHYVVMCHK